MQILASLSPTAALSSEAIRIGHTSAIASGGTRWRTALSLFHELVAQRLLDAVSCNAVLDVLSWHRSMAVLQGMETRAMQVDVVGLLPSADTGRRYMWSV